MAISFDSAEISTTTSWSHTVGGTNTYLVVEVVTYENTSPAATVSALTYGGVALSRINGATGTLSGSYQDVEIWGLAGATPGTGTVAVTLSRSAASIVGISQSYNGVAQSGSVDTSMAAVQTSSTTTYATTVTTAAADEWLAGIVWNFPGNAITAGSGTTLRQQNSASSVVGADSNGTVGVGAEVLNYSAASGTWLGAMVALVPASGGTSVSITGASSTGAAASLAPSLSGAPLGAAAAGTAAAVAPGQSGSAAAIAVFAASGVGALAPSLGTGAAAATATAAAGAVAAGSGANVSVAGAAASGAAGSVAPSLSGAPLGAAAAGTAAAVAPGQSGSAAAIAVFAASGVGALAPSLGTGAAAATATAAAGAVAAGSGANVSVAGAAASGAAGSVAQGAPDPAGAAATGMAAALGIVSEITLSPAVAFAAAVSVLGTLPAAAAYGIAGPVTGTVPALAADPVFIARGPRVRFTARGPAPRFTAIGRVGMRTNDLSPPIAANGETRTVTFDFGPQLAPSVTLTAIAAMNAGVHWGYADPTPDERWQGAAQIIASPTTNAPSQAVAQIFGNVPGATVYLLQCEASASDGTTPALETTVTSYVPQ